MKLDKLSLQFALHETGRQADVLEAYERLIHDAMSGDHTLFTTAEGIERLWELSTPLLADPPPVRAYPPGSWGPERHPPARSRRTRGACRSSGAGGRASDGHAPSADRHREARHDRHAVEGVDVGGGEELVHVRGTVTVRQRHHARRGRGRDLHRCRARSAAVAMTGARRRRPGPARRRRRDG